MGDLSILLLLQIRRIVAVHDRIPTQDGVEANLLVDLLHPLEVGLGGTLGAEDDVLYDVSCPLICICVWAQEYLTISSRERRFVSGTKNQMKPAPMKVRSPNRR